MSSAGFAASDSFRSSLEDAGRQYVRPGEVVNYTCTAVDNTGGLTTFWRGTAFNCPATSNVIALTHALFNSGVSGTCTDGAITGESVSAVDNCYTSRLMVTVSPALNGTTVECTLSLSGMGGGNLTILIAGMHACAYYCRRIEEPQNLIGNRNENQTSQKLITEY